ncbi:MAG TPA: zinc-binding dehydrogenase [Candidatus Bathyarchaeia archaeon]|nr:zinc-binding dehydrogenase [Candidatus Bathyarchaeia archaeon]
MNGCDHLVKAAVLTAPNQPIEVQEFPRPEKLEDGAALLKVDLAGICGTDIHLWHGRLKIPYPVIPGHETVGTLEEMGKGLEKDLLGKPLSVGDRIYFASGVDCGRCYYCQIAKEQTRCINRKVYGITLSCKSPPYLFGGHSEYVYLLPKAYLFRVPEDLPTESLVSVGCAAPTIIHGIEVVGVEAGDSVAIQGAGPIGLFALALAKESGASTTVVIDSVKERLEVAREMGADFLINTNDAISPQERVQRVLDLTDGIGADVVLECTGSPNALDDGLLMCRDSGRYLVVGHFTDRGTTAVNPHLITRKQLKIYGSWGMAPRHYYKALKILRTIHRKYHFEKLITHTFSIEKAQDAFETVENRKAVKAVFKP